MFLGGLLLFFFPSLLCTKQLSSVVLKSTRIMPLSFVASSVASMPLPSSICIQISRQAINFTKPFQETSKCLCKPAPCVSHLEWAGQWSTSGLSSWHRKHLVQSVARHSLVVLSCSKSTTLWTLSINISLHNMKQVNRLDYFLNSAVLPQLSGHHMVQTNFLRFPDMQSNGSFQ